MRLSAPLAGSTRHIPKLRGSLSRAKWVMASAVTTTALIFTPVAGVFAASDVTPPEVTDMELITDSSQDISDIRAAINVNIDASDDLSGMGGSILTYTSPSGSQSTWSYIQQRPEVTAPNQWFFDITVPQYSETGEWSPTLTMVDASGNTEVINNSQLIARGWDLRTTLTGTSDSAAPALVSAERVTPADLDSSSVNVIEIHLAINEQLSGFYNGLVTLTSPSGHQTATGDINPDGTGTFISTVNTAQYAESGTWTPSLTMTDSVSNRATYSSSALTAMGIDLHITLIGEGDTTAPVVNNIGFVLSSPVVENVPYGGANISVGGHFTDNLSGIANAFLSYTSNDGQYTNSELMRQPDNSYLADLSLPSFAQSGIWTPRLIVRDNAGNVTDLDATELTLLGYDMTFGVTKNVTVTADPGTTVTSDEENDGATTADPVEVSITTPSGGNVSIVIVASDAITDQTNGYKFFDRQISISAPEESAENPLSLAFQIDASKVPAGENQNTMQVTRNGVILPACTGAFTADPDGCVFSRQLLPDGDIKVSIHSTHASVWGSGFPIRQTPPTSHYHFSGFSWPIQNNGKWNNVPANATLPLRFSLGGKFGTKILAAGYPKVQRLTCSTKATIGTASSATSVNKKGLEYILGKYQYNWKSEKSYKNTCQQLTFKLDDGTTFSALFKF